MDCDYVVIGSGFGRSVSNLRLADKGEESDPYFNGMGPCRVDVPNVPGVW